MEEVARQERRKKASEVAADDLFNADKVLNGSRFDAYAAICELSQSLSM